MRTSTTHLAVIIAGLSLAIALATPTPAAAALKIGDACDPTEIFTDACGTGLACVFPFAVGTYEPADVSPKCYPKPASPISASRCRAMFNQDRADEAKELGRTLTLGTGFTVSGVVGQSIEDGVAYGPGEDEYGCYRTTCILAETSVASGSFYTARGKYGRFSDVDGESDVAYVGTPTPGVAFSYGEVGTRDFGRSIGDIHALAYGGSVGPFPIDAGVAQCTTDLRISCESPPTSRSTVYVDHEEDALCASGSSSKPVSSIDAGLSLVDEGGTLRIAPGSYDVSVISDFVTLERWSRRSGDVVLRR